MHAENFSYFVSDASQRILQVILGRISQCTSLALLFCRAQAIAERMMPAFDTPTGIPRGTINLGTQASAATSWAGGANGAVLSELGSVQVCHFCAH